jgi:hypothetical protein
MPGAQAWEEEGAAMSKLREAIAEARHTVNVCKMFWRSYTKWRAANPSVDAVFVHVGDPDIVQDVIKRSPRWQLFEQFEADQRMANTPMNAVPFNRDGSPRSAAIARNTGVTFKPRVVGPLQVTCDCPACTASTCDCPACTASKATRSFDA